MFGRREKRRGAPGIVGPICGSHRRKDLPRACRRKIAQDHGRNRRVNWATSGPSTTNERDLATGTRGENRVPRSRSLRRNEFSRVPIAQRSEERRVGKEGST